MISLKVFISVMLRQLNFLIIIKTIDYFNRKHMKIDNMVNLDFLMCKIFEEFLAPTK